MKKTTATTAVVTNCLSVSAIGQMLHTMLVKYLADIWVLSGEEVAFPLGKEQQERLMEALDVSELSKLEGYLSAIADLLEEDMHGMDIEDELGSFWIETVKLQCIASWAVVRKTSVQVQEEMRNLSSSLELAA